MKILSHTVRLIHIAFILFKYGLLWPIDWRIQQQHSRGKRILKAIEELGPIFVKFGQLLSTRVDLLPEDIIKELVRLQDQVPPFSGTVAKQMVEMSLSCSIPQIFQHFDTTPLASASIAQVHAATLLDGKTVVVKVLRPHVHTIIKRDIALLQAITTLLQRYNKKFRRFKASEIVAEFEKTLMNELDLMREAANASQLRRHFLHSTLLHIPEVHWQFTKHNILVMEQVYGISISQLQTLKQQGFDLKQLATRVIEIFFTQAFRDCFFHADLHPGNLFVCPKDPKNPKLIAVDFGMMGSLSQNDQTYLAENILAFLKRDYRQVAVLHRESGWVPKTIRMDEFESAIRTVCEPILEKPLKEISFGQLLFRLFQTASQFQINIQPQLILLQKTLLNIEGLSRQLDPEIDVFTTAKPFLEKWMKKQIGVQSLFQKLKAYAPDWMEKLPEIPNLFYNVLTQLYKQSRHSEVIFDD